MNQIEEFTKIYYNQVQEEENQVYQEEPKEEENLEEDDENKNNINHADTTKKHERRRDTSNRLNESPKRYKTYKIILTTIGPVFIGDGKSLHKKHKISEH